MWNSVICAAFKLTCNGCLENGLGVFALMDGRGMMAHHLCGKEQFEIECLQWKSPAGLSQYYQFPCHIITLLSLGPLFLMVCMHESLHGDVFCQLEECFNSWKQSHGLKAHGLSSASCGQRLVHKLSSSSLLAVIILSCILCKFRWSRWNCVPNAPHRRLLMSVPCISSIFDCMLVLPKISVICTQNVV